MSRVSICLVLLVTALAAAVGQVTPTGSKEYALANTSVARLESGGALYANPAGLARMHQHEVLLATGRFRELTSLTASLFASNLGTFAFGLSPDLFATTLNAGFGYLHDERIASGIGISFREKTARGWRSHVGGAWQASGTGPRDGLDVGAVLEAGPSKPTWVGGAGWWVAPGTFRTQFAVRSGIPSGGSIGFDMIPVEGMSVQIGVQRWRDLHAGFSLTFDRMELQFATGDGGASLSLNVRMGSTASEHHAAHSSEGYAAFGEGRYRQAAQSFRMAAAYNEYDMESRQLAEESAARLDSASQAARREAEVAESRNDYAAAMRAYAKLLRLNPEGKEVAVDLQRAEERLKTFVEGLVHDGDSLILRKETQKARAKYLLALELDPSNEPASAGIDGLDNLSKESARATLTRARELVTKGQLDDAEREFQRILAAEPKNAGARAGLAQVSKRRTALEFERAELMYADGKTVEALETFLSVLQADDRHQEARMYVDRVREELKPRIEEFFRLGLQEYVKEDYDAAVSQWNKALLIAPGHSAILEYKRRAEEKQEALKNLR